MIITGVGTKGVGSEGDQGKGREKDLESGRRITKDGQDGPRHRNTRVVGQGRLGKREGEQKSERSIPGGIES